jgi:hypothetical protein
MDLLIYLPLPAAARKPVPVFLNLSFTANSSAVDDPGIKPGEVWGRDKKRGPAPKGGPLGKLDVAPFLAAGIGVAAVYYGDIEPDFLGGCRMACGDHISSPDRQSRRQTSGAPLRPGPGA